MSRPGRGIDRLSPWTLIALAGCATLALVDFWRDQSPGAWPLVQGTTPNPLAVPTLVFGFLMLRFPERRPYTPETAVQQDRLFWRLLAVATVTLFCGLSRVSFLQPG